MYITYSTLLKFWNHAVLGNIVYVSPTLVSTYNKSQRTLKFATCSAIEMDYNMWVLLGCFS